MVAKRCDGPYEPGKRGWVKVKHQRTADCVVAGFRWHKDGEGVGSLLLGLYDDAGNLHSSVSLGVREAQRKELVEELAPLRERALDDHPWREWAELATVEHGTRMPGAVSRWSGQASMSWEPLRLERVAEVTFNQLTNGRLRHPANFLRWRDDREPSSCRYDQLEVASRPRSSNAVFGA